MGESMTSLSMIFWLSFLKLLGTDYSENAIGLSQTILERKGIDSIRLEVVMLALE